jgi:DNA-directed RNA polymerase specialized sigma24 family protein
MINDGYDDPSTEQMLALWDGWLHQATDRYRLRNDPGYEDLLQEARIEFWKQYEALTEETPGDRRRFALHRARLKMGRLASTNPQVRDRETGHLRANADVPTPMSLDALENPDAFLGVIEAVEEVALAYHYGEIHQAISALPPRHRAYVVARFWEGFNDSQIARDGGLTPATLIYHWRKNIQPLLQESLAHLAGAT